MYHNEMLEFITVLQKPQNPRQKNLIMIPYNLHTEFGVKGNMEVNLKINGTEWKLWIFYDKEDSESNRS